MSKIIVIGAGASGIIASLQAIKNNEVLLFDSNEKIGKKILITGNGRCNYWNDAIAVDKYYTDNINNLSIILNNKEETLNFLDSLGIYPKKINGYYYPYNNQANSIRQIFEREILKSGIELHLNESVDKIEIINNKFQIKSSNSTYEADKVIIATGSKAYPKLGSVGKGYELLYDLGLDLNPVLPALTKLISNDQIVNKWENIRCEGTITINVDGEDLISESGELQLTKNGISGIPTFNVSSVASKHIGSKVIAKIDFLKDIENLYSFMENTNKGFTLEEVLESLLNYKLTYALFDKMRLDKTQKWINLSENDKNTFIKNIKEFKLNIIDTDSYDNSQVCTGGLSLDEINPITMEVNKIPNLFVTGEILDVDGQCGGYNLGFAFITGYIAGRNIK